MIMEIIGIFISLLILIISLGNSLGGGLAWITDPPTLLCMFVLTFPVLLKEGLGKDFIRAFKLLRKEYRCSFSELRHALDVVEMMQKQILCAGVIVSFQGLFLLLHSLSDLASIGPNTSVALLAVFYTAIFELLMLPLQIEAKRRIVDYIEQDTEETEKKQGIESTEKEQDTGEEVKEQDIKKAEKE